MSPVDPALTAPWLSDTHDLLTRTLSHAVVGRVVTTNELRRNLVTNPGLEFTVTGWAATTGTFSRDTVAPIDGTASAKVVAAGGTAIGIEYRPTSIPENRIPVEPGGTIAISVKAKCSLAGAGIRLDLGWLDEAGNTAASATVGTGSAIVASNAANTVYTLSYAAAAVPLTATRVWAHIRTVSGGVAAGTALWADTLYAGLPGGYFDGNTTDTTTETYDWTGTVGYSQSIATDPLAPNATTVLEIEGGTVSFDENRSPRAMATGVTCRVPDSQGTLDTLDPRTGARLQIDAGYSRPDGLTDVNPLVDLCLRSRPVTRPDDTMVLEGHGDESLLIDNAPSNGGALNTTTTVAGITAVVRMIFPQAAVANPSALTGPAVAQSPVGDKHDLMLDLSDRLEAKTYDDGLRNWGIYPAPSLSTPALALAVGPGGTIIESEATVTRDDDWYNRVFLTYDWTDASDVQHKVVAVRSVTSGPYAARIGNVRTMELTRNIPATQSEANAAATALVKRAVTRGRSFTISAVSAYWLRPGMTVSVQLPLGAPEEHLVSSVAFDLKAGRMTVTTRLPDGVYTIGA